MYHTRNKNIFSRKKWNFHEYFKRYEEQMPHVHPISFKINILHAIINIFHARLIYICKQKVVWIKFQFCKKLIHSECKETENTIYKIAVKQFCHW